MIITHGFVVDPNGQSISKIYTTPPFFQNGAKSGFEMCFGPSTLGAGAKTRLESRIKQFTPHCVDVKTDPASVAGCVFTPHDIPDLLHHRRHVYPVS